MFRDGLLMNNTFSRRTFGLAAASSIAVVLGACGAPAQSAPVPEGPWGDAVKAAANEGPLAFYSGLTEIQNTRLVAAFNKKYPAIKVQATRGGVEIIARVEGEMQSGSEGADVFVHADPAWYQARSNDLAPATGPASAAWPEAGWAIKGVSPVATVTPNSVFVWNTDIFPNGFKTWDDLLAPGVKGKIGLRTDAATKSAAGYLDMIETELGYDYLVKLTQQQPKSYTSVVPMTQAVASGEVGVTNASLPSMAKELKDKGAPVDYLIPNPGYAIEFASAALKKSKRPNAAAIFIDFIMTPEGQAALNGDGFGGSVGPDNVPGALDLDGIVMMDSAKLTPDVITKLDAKLAQLYKG